MYGYKHHYNIKVQTSETNIHNVNNLKTMDKFRFDNINYRYIVRQK